MPFGTCNTCSRSIRVNATRADGDTCVSEEGLELPLLEDARQVVRAADGLAGDEDVGDGGTRSESGKDCF